MQKIFSRIFFIAILLPLFLGAVTPRVAHASCGIGGVSDAITGNSFRIPDCVNNITTMVVFPIVGKLLQISGFLFGQAVKMNMNIASIVDSSNGQPTVIGEVWRNIRDLSSILFIGVLLYASFRMVLGVGGSNVNSLIVSMVIAGLLMNFSLFGTRLIIDASNTASLLFYNAITPAAPAPATAKVSAAGINVTAVGSALSVNPDDGGISNNIMDALELQSILATTKTPASQWVLQSIIVMIGGAVIMLISAIAFLAGALMFVYRLVILILLMAFSPLPVVAMILPDLKKYSGAWTSALLGQCMFAPIYLFLMYVALKIATDPRLAALFGSGGHKNLADVFALGNTGFIIGPLIQYVVVIMLMYYALVAAKSYGGHGADMGIKWMKGMQSWGQSFVGAQTIGRGARILGKSYDQLASSMPTLSKLNKIPVLGGLVKMTDRAIAGGLKDAETSKFGGSNNLAGFEKAVKDRTTALKGVAKTTNRDKDIENALAVLKNTNSTAAEMGAAHVTLKDSIKKISAAELKELDKDKLKDSHFAARLSGSQFESIMKDDAISEDDKKAIRKARAEGFTAIIKTTGTVNKTDSSGNVEMKNGVPVTKNVMGPSELLKEKTVDIAKMDPETVVTLAPHLSEKQYDYLVEEHGESSLSEEVRNRITEARKDRLLDDTEGAALPTGQKLEELKGLVKSMSQKELTQALGDKTVERMKKIAPFIHQKHLKDIVKNTAVTKNQVAEIAKEIVAKGDTALSYAYAKKILTESGISVGNDASIDIDDQQWI